MIFIYSLIHHSAVPIYFITKFHTFIILWSSFDGFIPNRLNEVQWLVFIWLVAQMVEDWTRIAEVKGLNPVKACIFSGFLKDASKTAMILNIFASLPPVPIIYDFHNLYSLFHRFSTCFAAMLQNTFARFCCLCYDSLNHRNESG